MYGGLISKKLLRGIIMKKKITIIALLILIFPVLISAQGKLAIGPVAGVNININTGSFFDSGSSGVGLALGAQADLTLTNSIGLVGNLYFIDSRYGQFKVSNVTYDASYSYITLEVLLKYKISLSGFYLLVGPSVGINTKSTDYTVYPASYSISYMPAKYSTTAGIADQKIIGTTSSPNMRFELKGGIGYDMSIGKSTTLSPFVTFGYGLTNVIKDQDWKIITIQVGCSLKFDLI